MQRAVAALPGDQQLASWIEAVLNQHPDASREITIRIVDVAEITDLNHRYRNKEKPTNVLSFPADRPEGLPPEIAAQFTELGDIAICAQVVANEAAEQAKAEIAHWAHMVIHGTLHLLGYDHIATDEAAEMEALEITLLAEFGYSDPYAL